MSRSRASDASSMVLSGESDMHSRIINISKYEKFKQMRDLMKMS